MKFRNSSLDIDPKQPFSGDALERKPLVEFLEGVIAKAEGPLVLALDSPWGTGKTTLVKMLQAQLEAKQYRCVYFNAWAVDFASDPLVALVSKIGLLGEGVTPKSQTRMKKLKSIATLVGKRGLIAAIKLSTLGALDLQAEIEAALAEGASEASSDLFDLVTKEAECLAKFREELQAVIGEAQPAGSPDNLIFFIDELDRCRPSFAIELLERVKHLFDVPNIIFVLSIDKSQLEISTSSIYGSGINAREYLRRFIDLEFQVPPVSGKLFVIHLVKRFGLDAVFSQRDGELRNDLSRFTDVFCVLAKLTDMSLRTQEHCIARLSLVMDQIKPRNLLYPVLAASLIVTRSMHPQLFVQLRSGVSSTEEFMRWLRDLDTGRKLTGHVALALESYMNAADENEARCATRQRRLEALANDAGLDSTDRKHASDVSKFTADLLGSFNGAPKLTYLISKVDLAESLQP